MDPAYRIVMIVLLSCASAAYGALSAAGIIVAGMAFVFGSLAANPGAQFHRELTVLLSILVGVSLISVGASAGSWIIFARYRSSFALIPLVLPLIYLATIFWIWHDLIRGVTG